EQCAYLRVVPRRGAGTPGRSERDECGVGQLELTGGRTGEELRVLRHGTRPATLDEPDTELVEMPCDGELVGHRVRDPLTLGPVAQRGVVQVEVVAERGAGRFRAGHGFVSSERVRAGSAVDAGLCGQQKRPPA